MEKTFWHPSAERRTALIHTESGVEEIREGDAVGSLRVSTIEPSGVVFDQRGQEIRRREEQQEILLAIDGLPPKQRHVVIDRLILDLPWGVVAATRGTSVAAAQMALARAKRKLSRLLASHGVTI